MKIYEELRYLRSLEFKALLETAQITLEIAKHSNHYLASNLKGVYEELKDLKSYDLTEEHNFIIDQMIKIIVIINAAGGKTV